jgi:hypothetical protein
MQLAGELLYEPSAYTMRPAYISHEPQDEILAVSDEDSDRATKSKSL